MSNYIIKYLTKLAQQTKVHVAVILIVCKCMIVDEYIEVI